MKTHYVMTEACLGHRCRPASVTTFFGTDGLLLRPGSYVATATLTPCADSEIRMSARAIWPGEGVAPEIALPDGARSASLRFTVDEGAAASAYLTIHLKAARGCLTVEEVRVDPAP